MLRYATLRYATATLRYATATLRYATATLPLRYRYATATATATLRYATLRYGYPTLRYATLLLRYATAMPCHAMPCYAVLCYAMLCYAMYVPLVTEPAVPARSTHVPGGEGDGGGGDGEGGSGGEGGDGGDGGGGGGDGLGISSTTRLLISLLDQPDPQFCSQMPLVPRRRSEFAHPTSSPLSVKVDPLKSVPAARFEVYDSRRGARGGGDCQAMAGSTLRVCPCRTSLCNFVPTRRRRRYHRLESHCAVGCRPRAACHSLSVSLKRW